MADAVVIKNEHAENTGYRFSWSLAIVGGVIATAVTFFLLTLGSGFGLLLVNPATHAGPSMPTFLTGGAIYFIVAQAFGFAVGGHIAGRLIGGLSESKKQEEFRAEAHGLAVWAVAVLATLAVVVIATLGTLNSAAAMYGVSTAKAEAAPTDYLVDILFRPAEKAGASTGVAPTAAEVVARAEARRIVDAGLGLGMKPTTDDRARLIQLVSANATISQDDAARRIDRLQAQLKTKAEQAANVARKVASYTALWMALSLLFGAIVSTTAAVEGRDEDDRESVV